MLSKIHFFQSLQTSDESGIPTDVSPPCGEWQCFTLGNWKAGHIDQCLAAFLNSHVGWNGRVEMAQPHHSVGSDFPLEKYQNESRPMLSCWYYPQNCCRFPCSVCLCLFISDCPNSTFSICPIKSIHFMSLHFCPVLLSITLSFSILASEVIYIGPVKGKLCSFSVLYSAALLPHPCFSPVTLWTSSQVTWLPPEEVSWFLWSHDRCLLIECTLKFT